MEKEPRFGSAARLGLRADGQRLQPQKRSFSFLSKSEAKWTQQSRPSVINPAPMLSRHQRSPEATWKSVSSAAMSVFMRLK